MTFDEKDSASAHVDSVSGEYGEYDLVVMEVQIEQGKWDNIRTGLKSDMEDFFDWIESKRTD